MWEVRDTRNAYSIYRIHRTAEIKEIGFGKEGYYETRMFHLNAKEHGFKTGVIRKELFLCGHWREVNKGYAREFDIYRTHHPKMQKHLYGDTAHRRIHVPDLDLDELDLFTGLSTVYPQADPVDIVILTYQRKYYLFQVIDQILRMTKHPYRLIVVDNGSTDGTRDWIKKWHKAGIVWKYIFKENGPISEAFKSGFKEVESDLFITTPDDIPPSRRAGPCWLTKLVELIDKYPEYISISSDFGNTSFLKYLVGKYGKLRYNEEFTKTWREKIIPKLNEHDRNRVKK